MAHVNAEIPQLTGTDALTTHLNGVLQRAMAKDPAQRYAGADELRAALLDAGRMPGAGSRLPASASADRTAVRRPVPTMPPPKKSGPAKGLLIGVGAVCILLVAGLAAFFLTRGSGHGGDDGTAPAAGPTKPAKTVAGDANGDGRADLTFLVRGDSQTQRVTFLSQSGGGYGSQIAHKWAGGFKALSGDVNGDGKADLVSVDTSKIDGITIRVVDHATGKDTTQVIHTNNIDTPYIVPGDFNGDGYIDLAYFVDAKDNKSASIYVSLGTKSGRWADPKLWFTHKDWSTLLYSLRAGDFNGDGKTDLTVFFDLQNNVRFNPKLQKTGRDATGLLTSTGTKFNHIDATMVREFPVPVNIAQGGVSWQLDGDITGDGKPDEVYVNQYPKKRSIQVSTWNDKTGFSPLSKPWYDGPSAAAVKGTSSDTFDLADIDGDGKRDLVILHQIAKGTYTVFWQKSTGTSFRPPKQLVTYASQLPRAWNGALAEVF